MDETNKETYELSKLKKFMIFVKLIMQDTLMFICQRNFNGFLESLRSFIPKSIKITSINDVKMTFYTNSENEKKEPL